MKDILIVLFATAAFAVIGFIGTAEIARQNQNRNSPPTNNAMADLATASGNLSDRQTYAMIGGGVGVGVGLIAGFLLTRLLNRKKTSSR